MHSVSSMEELKKYKLVFLGDQGVGKTSIVSRFIYQTYDNVYQATVGIDFLSKTVRWGGKSTRLQLWDTAGQERFRSLIPSYIRDCAAAIVVYDVTNRDSFNSVDRWIKEVLDVRSNNTIIVLVGNKIDMELERQISKEEVEEHIKGYNGFSIETSAQNGENITEMFKKIISILNSDKEGKNAIKKPIDVINLTNTVDRSSERKSICLCQ